ncbi:MAG: recombination mediator RecR [Alphaproteobacteria bacterium]|nr:recombination mediator RecR [Alphaproteobacteria bacterium]
MNNKIENLIKKFAKLPRVGGRGGQRIVLALLQDKTGKSIELASALIDTAQSIKPCETCGVLTDTNTNHGNEPRLCEYCTDTSRANGQLCIVRDLGDVWTFEKAGVYRGRYHIIGGLLSAATGITPDDLNIKNLSDRIKNEKITEIIFALPSTMEGKTTQHFIISDIGFLISDLKLSELASGIPLGGDLDYVDDGTLSIAFGGRKNI